MSDTIECMFQAIGRSLRDLRQKAEFLFYICQHTTYHALAVANAKNVARVLFD